MKISVQFEAESAEDYDRILEALTGPGRAVFHVAPSPKPDQPVVTVKTEETPPPVRDEPVIEVAVPAPAPVKAKRGRKPKVIVPDVPTETIPDVPVTIVQTEAKPIDLPNGPTRVDLSDAFKAYVHLYGTNAGFADVSKLLQKTFGDTVRKASDVSDENIARAIAVVRQALDENPFNRERTYDN